MMEKNLANISAIYPRSPMKLQLSRVDDDSEYNLFGRGQRAIMERNEIGKFQIDKVSDFGDTLEDEFNPD